MNASGAPEGAPLASEGGEILHRLPAGDVGPAVPPRPGLSGRVGRSLQLGLHAYLVLYAMHLALDLAPGRAHLALDVAPGRTHLALHLAAVAPDEPGRLVAALAQLALHLGPGALDLALQPVARGHAPPLVAAKVGPHLTLELGQLALGALAARVRLGRLDQVFTGDQRRAYRDEDGALGRAGGPSGGRLSASRAAGGLVALAGGRRLAGGGPSLGFSLGGHGTRCSCQVRFLGY